MDIEDQMQRDTTITAFAVADADQVRVVPGPTSMQAARSRKHLNIGAWNVRSCKLESTQLLLARELQKYKINVCCLSETRLNDVLSKKLTVSESDSFQFYNSGPNDGSGKQGVGFLIDGPTASCVTSWEPVSPRIAMIRLRGHISHITIIAVYAPIRDSSDAVKDAFYYDLQRIIDKTPRRDMLFVAGDWNARLGRVDPDTAAVIGRHTVGDRCINGERLLQLARYNNLCVTNTLFEHKRLHLVTWRSNDGVTTAQIDHILVSRRWRSSCTDARVYRGADTGSLNGSDHYLLTCKVRHRLSRQKRQKAGKRFDVSKLRCPEIKADFELKLSNRFDALNRLSLVDEEWAQIKIATQDVAEEVLGHTKRKQRAWISDHTIELVEKKRPLVGGAKEPLKVARKAVKQSLKRDREQYWSDLANELEQASRSHNSRKMFKLLKEATGKAPVTVDTLKDKSGELIRTEEGRMERWREHFSELLNPVKPPCDLPAFSSAAREPYAVNLDPPSIADVQKALKCMKNNKTPGEDGIPSEMFKSSPTLLCRLTDLFVQVWTTKTFPKDWKVSVLVPLYKKGDKAICGNYRGISLIDHAMKIFCVILLNRFKDARDKLTRPEQAGFRPGRGCPEQILTIRLILQQYSRFHLPLLIAFIDFAAAFDSLIREELWRIMAEDGAPQEIIEILRSAYKDTETCVRVSGNDTPKFPVEFGVKQGCPLSPILFNYAIDWIMYNAMRNHSGIVFGQIAGFLQPLTDLDFADDVAELETTADSLQGMIDDTYEVSKRIGLAISGAKTKVLALNQPAPCQVTLDGEPIESVEEFKYLGSIITPDGGAERDISARIAKAWGVFTSLKKALWTRREISTKTKVRIYGATVRAVLLYACETWPIKTEDARTLDVFDHRCLRYILRIKRWDRISNSEVRSRCGQSEELSLIIKRRRLKLLGHTLRRPEGTICRDVLVCEPAPSWKRKPGGQKKNLWQKFKEDLEPWGGFRRHGRRWDKDWLKIAGEAAADRSKWSSEVIPRSFGAGQDSSSSGSRRK